METASSYNSRGLELNESQEVRIGSQGWRRIPSFREQCVNKAGQTQATEDTRSGSCRHTLEGGQGHNSSAQYEAREQGFLSGSHHADVDESKC